MEGLQARLSALPFWERLKESQRQSLLRGTSEQNLSRGTLLKQGVSENSGLLQVLRGAIRVHLLSEEGREVTLFHLRAGDICTLGASEVTASLPFVPQMTVEEDCQLLTIRAAAMKGLMEENLEVRAFVHEEGSRHLAQMVWAMEQILFLRVDRRLAAFLVEESRRTGSCEIRMTHEQIAQQISSAREVVARMIKRFSSQGLVEARRGTIHLVDLAGLQKLNP